MLTVSKEVSFPLRSLRPLPTLAMALAALAPDFLLGNQFLHGHSRIIGYSTFFILLSIYSFTRRLLSAPLAVLSAFCYIASHIIIVFLPFTENSKYYGVILTPIAMLDLASLYTMLYYSYKFHFPDKAKLD